MFIDRFSALDDLPPKHRGNVFEVLAALEKAGRFSTFEVCDRLAGPVTMIIEKGWVETSGEYPWTYVKLTDAGRTALRRAKGEA